jgi:hypothetical protein
MSIAMINTGQRKPTSAYGVLRLSVGIEMR